MKKYFFILMILSSISVSAQIDFFQFINSVDWNSTENEFVEKYSTQIKSQSHFYSNYNKTKTDYEIVGIFFGNKECTASIFVDSASLKLESLSFSFGKSKTSDNPLDDAIKFSTEMDNLLVPQFGEPDVSEDDFESKHIKELNRIWYKDNYIVSVMHMIFSDHHFYNLSVKGINNKSADFRVAKWGDSKKNIMQKEGKTNLSNFDDIYMFSDYVAGIICDVVYIFTNDKLTMAKYLFKPTHSNKNDFIKDYRELVNLMKEKYGKPSYNAPEWHNYLYKDTPEDYGLAISVGHLLYGAGWLGETTNITVLLNGENNNISLIIQYVSKKYESSREKANIQRKIKDL